MYYDYVVVGGGAGGLELVSRLGRHFGREGHDKVLLIDKSSYHIWKPTLHEVAVGTLNPQQEGLSYSILARSNHFSFACGQLLDFDPENKSLTLEAVFDDENEAAIIPERNIRFGQCVLAIGSGSNFFNTPGAAEHAYVLEHSLDAVDFQQHLLNLFSKAAYGDNKNLDVVIVGAGATGVELAAEMLEAYHEILPIFGSSQKFDIHISLIESAPRILAGLPERISVQAAQALRAKSVSIYESHRAVEVGTDFVVMADKLRPDAEPQRIHADVVVWAAGIKAAESNADYGLPVNRLNQFEVDTHLQTPFAGVYALGDCAACPWHDDKILPARAQVAHQQASYLADKWWHEYKQRPFTQSFVYKDYGSLVSLGNNQGVGNLMGSLSGGNFFIEGLIAKWMYMSLHLKHHAAILGYWKTGLLAIARLAQSRVSGRLKLH